MINDIQRLRKQIKKEKPLIHCITNPISIHDCANVVLAAGGRPIMAEHPKEVAEITKTASALMLNLGNITDARTESMKISLKAANEKGIPVLLDLVGVACSTFRREYALELINSGRITVLKGNMSELLAMAGEPSHSIGIDAGGEDVLTCQNQERILEAFRRFSENMDAVILASGKEDLVVDREHVYQVANGSALLPEITGTGCMLGALCATYLAGAKDGLFNPVCAVLLGTILMGVSGEMAAKDCPGTGTFQIRLLDWLYSMDEELLGQMAKLRKKS